MTGRREGIIPMFRCDRVETRQVPRRSGRLMNASNADIHGIKRTRMWANAQRDGRPALCSTPQSLADPHY